MPNNEGIGMRLSSWLMLVVSTCLILLLVRLISLQLVQGGRNLVLANENRIKKIILPASRGKILDRNGTVLAESVDGKRKYPLGPDAGHVVGYLGEVGENEVGLLTPKGDKYKNQGMVGRMGLESQYEESLRGVDGGRLVEVDTSGREVRELGVQQAVKGIDLKTTIDASLQKTAGEALTRPGAVVVSNPKTGEVLALVSSPSFDPQKVLPTSEFFNRAIGGVYPPGSTFKMITTVAALSENKVPSSFTYEDTGAINVGKFAYTNWFFTQYGRTEGVVGWVKALSRSTDTFFYKVGELAGPETMATWAQKMGLGQVTGLDLPGEVSGLVPTPEWKEKAKNEQWFLGNTYHMAIGQGDVLATPLQVNLMTNVIASGGEKCKPHLLKSQIPNPKSQINSNDQNFQCSKIDINTDILDIVKKGMIGACTEGGTAYPFFDWNQQMSNALPADATHQALQAGKSQYPKVACKTGTAEYVRSDGRTGSHAWFTVYAPADDPTISVTVLVEGGGEGSTAAAPIARKILAKYFGVEDKFNYSVVQGVGE